MAKTRAEKEQSVHELKEKFERTESVVLTDYHGITVTQMQELKNDLKPMNAEFTVAKNTLLSRASKEAKKELPQEYLKGPTAILLSFDDPIEPIKKLAEFIKKYELPIIKSGLFEGKLLTKEGVVELSKITSKDKLYARVVGALNSAISSLVNVMSGNMRNLVYVLSAIKESSPPAGGSKGGAN